jgi:tetratricopeptide (TPR) repeat protein
MDKDKQIRKIDKFSLKKLSENSRLVKRGLRDLGIWPKIQTILQKIKKQYYARNYLKCINLCNEILNTEAHSFYALTFYAFTFKGLSHIRLGNYEDAIICFDQLLEEKADFNLALERKGFCLLKLGKYHESITFLKKALSIYPEDPVVLYDLGCAFDAIGDYEEAIKFYDKALEILDRDLSLNPNFIGAIIAKGLTYKNIGYCYEAIGNHEEAIKTYKKELEMYDRVLSIHPNYIEAILFKAQAYNRLGKRSEAGEYFAEYLIKIIWPD